MQAVAPLTSRRVFIKKSLAFSALCLVTSKTMAKSFAVRTVGFDNLHTGESLRLDYWEQGQYIEESMQKIDHVLRDHRANEVHPIDFNLIDQLHQLNLITGNNEPYKVISGYRSAATNEMLRKNSSGVAKKSMHTQGRAIDIQLPGLTMRQLRDVAASMKAGGVGLYNSFVHIDTGRVRYW